jgi:hypothetical protein
MSCRGLRVADWHVLNRRPAIPFQDAGMRLPTCFPGAAPPTASMWDGGSENQSARDDRCFIGEYVSDPIRRRIQRASRVPP